MWKLTLRGSVMGAGGVWSTHHVWWVAQKCQLGRWSRLAWVQEAHHDNCSAHTYLGSQVSHVTFCFSLKSFLLYWLLLKLGWMGGYFEGSDFFLDRASYFPGNSLFVALCPQVMLFAACVLGRKSHDMMVLGRNIECWQLLLFFSTSWMFLTVFLFFGVLTHCLFSVFPLPEEM